MKRSGTIQCHNCQRLHHTTNQCHFQYRCVQCTTQHKWNECPRLNNKSIPIGCINCLEAKLDHTQHTANDLLNCKFYKELQANKAKGNGGGRNGSRTQVGSQSASVNGIVSTSLSVKSSTAGSGGPRQSYASTLRPPNAGMTGSNKGNSSIDGVDIEKLISLTIRGVLAALRNGA